MSRIYWDSMLFIYLLEGTAAERQRVRLIRDRMQDRGDELCTSVLSAAEVLTGPRKTGEQEMIRGIQALFRSPDLTVLDFHLSTAEMCATIRAQHGVKTADAIHLSCAAEARVDLFLTNDRKLHGKKIPGIHFIAGLDVNVL